jgi:membrane protease YdiL (CAAX protease family)
LLNETQAQRLRLLLIAGVLAPALMALAGLGLGLLPGGRMPALGRGFTLPALGLGAVATALSMGLVSLLYRIHPRFEEALRRSGMKVGLDALDVAGYPVMIVVVTASAFGEELLFRGGLQPLVGVIPAALLFGFSHGGWRREMIAYAVAASVSGSLFGLAYCWSQNIWVPVSAHALHNILSTILMGKKVDVTWEGWRPRVRLLPEVEEDEETEAPPAPAAVSEPAVSVLPDPVVRRPVRLLRLRVRRLMVRRRPRVRARRRRVVRMRLQVRYRRVGSRRR